MKTRHVLPVYESEWLVKDSKLNPDPSRPVRYVPRDIRVPFWRKLWLLARHRKWIDVERHFRPVYPGTPGYEEARYESMEL